MIHGIEIYGITDSREGPERAVERIIEASKHGMDRVIIRGFIKSDMENILRRIEGRICGKTQVIINGDVDEAYTKWNIEGYHLNRHRLVEFNRRNNIAHRGIIGASVHTTEEFQMAINIGVEYVLLSPIFAPSYNSNAETMGIEYAERIIKEMRGFAQKEERAFPKVIALGGLNPDNFKKLLASKVRFSGAALMSGMRNLKSY